MILSRTIAKRRIARGDRPSWGAAWGLVIADFVLFAIYTFVVYSLAMGWILVVQPAPVWIYIAAFALVFVPMQAVLIFSSLWASRSRFLDTDLSE